MVLDDPITIITIIMYPNKRGGVKIYIYKNGILLKFYSFCVMMAAVVLNLISKVIHTADSIFGLY